MRRLYGPEALAAYVFEETNITMHDGTSATNVTVNASEHRRLVTQYAQMAADSYTPSGTYFQNGNSFVLQSGCDFAFRGSDDKDDWMSNLSPGFSSLFESPGTDWNGLKVHSGFLVEFQKVEGALNTAGISLTAAVTTCKDAGETPNFIGHSLGGAMANLARVQYGEGNIYTYGAPSVFADTAPKLTGYRMWHQSDPVPKAPELWFKHPDTGDSYQIKETRVVKVWCWTASKWWRPSVPYLCPSRTWTQHVELSGWNEFSIEDIATQIVQNLANMLWGGTHYHSMGGVQGYITNSPSSF